MSKGFIDLVGGVRRLRWVKSGFDARDYATPANAVIFDSDANTYLQVYLAGTVAITDGSNAEYKPVTWPSLGYIPFAWACFRKSGYNMAPVPSSPTSTYSQGAVSVEANGLLVETRGLNYPVELDYVIWRASAL